MEPGFFHFEVYAAEKKSPKKPDARSVVAEALRIDGFCPHVPDKQAPVIIGANPMELIDKQMEIYHSLRRRKTGIRVDARVMIAGVTSIKDTMLDKIDIYEWVRKNIEFVEKEFGKHLLSIVFHNDERHPHLHFYIFPEPDGNGKKFRVCDLHPGEREDRSYAINDKSEIKYLTYSKRMSALQDRYFESVSCHFGMTRFSKTPRRRQKRAESILESSVNEIIQEEILKRSSPFNFVLHSKKLKNQISLNNYKELIDFIEKTEISKMSLYGKLTLLLSPRKITPADAVKMANSQNPDDTRAIRIISHSLLAERVPDLRGRVDRAIRELSAASVRALAPAVPDSELYVAPPDDAVVRSDFGI
jgi:hypothetical protein